MLKELVWQLQLRRTSNAKLLFFVGLRRFRRRIELLLQDSRTQIIAVLLQRSVGDQKLLGLSLTAYVLIGMDRHTPERFENFEAAIRNLPQVLECSLVTGMDADYQLKVVVPDMDHYQKLLLGHLTRIDGVTSVRSTAFSSSRTLPGHSYCIIRITDSGVNSGGSILFASAKRLRKCSTSNGMSARRSRSAGTRMGNTWTR